MKGEQQLLQKLVSEEVLETTCRWLAEDGELSLSEWWRTRKAIRQRLLSGEYCFHPVRVEPGADGERYCWHQEDQFVLYAMAVVLGRSFGLDVTLASAVDRAVSAIDRCGAYLDHHPNGWVLQGDLADYFRRIDHQLLYHKLSERFAGETVLLRLLWQYLMATIEKGGAYIDLDQGLLPGNPLFSILCELYLEELDRTPGLGSAAYVRFQSEWILVAPTRWSLESIRRCLDEGLERLGLRSYCRVEEARRVDVEGCFIGLGILSDKADPADRQKTISDKILQYRRCDLFGSAYSEQEPARWPVSAKDRLERSIILPNDDVAHAGNGCFRYCSTLPHSLWAIPLMGGAGMVQAAVQSRAINQTVTASTVSFDLEFDGDVGNSEWSCYGVNAQTGFPAGAISCAGYGGGVISQWDPNPGTVNEAFGAGGGLVNNNAGVSVLIPDGQTRYFRVKIVNPTYYGWVQIRRSGSNYIFENFVYEDSGAVNTTMTPGGSSNNPPVLGGTFTTATIDDDATTTPFSGVTVTDADGDPVSISITYTSANGTLSGTGLTGSAGNYTLTSATAATVQTRLQALVFTPTTNLSSSNTVTTFTLTPNDGTVNGTANSSTQITASPVVPTVTSVNVPANATYLQGDNLDFTVNTSENVTVTNTPRLTLSIGPTTKYANYLSGSGSAALVFRYTVESGLSDSDGIGLAGTIDLNATGVLQDSGGSNLNTTLNSIGSLAAVLVDSAAPSVQIQNAPSGVNNNNPFSVTFQFSEDVTGFVVGDITVGNGSASNFTSVSANEYTADITPSGAGNITIDVAANVAEDSATNGNTAATQVTVAYDATAPSVQIQNAPSGVNNNNPFSVTFQFSEDVTGFIVGDITVGNGSASNFTSVSANEYTADITPSGAGNITIDVAANVAEDSATNGNTAATQVTVVYDATAPSVQIQNAPSSVENTNPFGITIQFSESVTGFSIGDITVGNGSASNFNGSGDTYTANITPSGSGDITIDVAANVAEDSATNGNTAATQVTVSCGTGCNRDVIVSVTQRAIQNFIGGRMLNITSDGPELSGFLDGDGMGGGIMGISPVEFNFSNDNDRNSGSFSTSLQQFLNLQAKLDGNNSLLQAGPNTADDGLPSVENNRPYAPANIWIKGRWSRSSEDRGDVDEKSDFAIVYAGADYRYSPDLLVGVMGQFDWTDEKSEGLGVEAEGKGWMLGPYLVTRLSDSVVLDVRGLWGKSDNKVNPFGTYWDDFKTERWQLKGNLTGSFDYGKWNLSPAVGLSYFEETQQEYTDSNGFIIGEQTFSLGTLDFGPTISYTYQDDDGLLIKPQIAIKGIWDFDAPDILDVNGLAVGTEGLRAKLKVGLNMIMPNGASIYGSYSYDGIGVSDFESHTGQLAVSIPFDVSWLPKNTLLQGSCSVQGINVFDRLDQNGANEDYDVQLSVKIPLD